MNAFSIIPPPSYDLPDFTGLECCECGAPITALEIEVENVTHDYEGWGQDDEGRGVQIFNQRHKFCPQEESIEVKA